MFQHQFSHFSFNHFKYVNLHQLNVQVASRICLPHNEYHLDTFLV